jgi:hypothetical protein
MRQDPTKKQVFTIRGPSGMLQEGLILALQSAEDTFHSVHGAPGISPPFRWGLDPHPPAVQRADLVVSLINTIRE